MASKLFTQDQDQILISLVKNSRCLYDVQDPNYSNVNLKNNTWKDISNEINHPNITSMWCKTRWYNIRDAFIKNKRNNESTNNQTFKKNSSYKYDHLLTFLDSYVEQSETDFNTIVEEEEEEEGEDEEEEEEGEDKEEEDKEIVQVFTQKDQHNISSSSNNTFLTFKASPASTTTSNSSSNPSTHFKPIILPQSSNSQSSTSSTFKTSLESSTIPNSYPNSSTHFKPIFLPQSSNCQPSTSHKLQFVEENESDLFNSPSPKRRRNSSTSHSSNSLETSSSSDESEFVEENERHSRPLSPNTLILNKFLEIMIEKEKERQIKERDPVEAFLRFVASVLRTFPPHICIKAKRDIFNIVNKYEYISLGMTPPDDLTSEP